MSAGGPEAVSALLQHLPDRPGFALVVVPHLVPTQPGSLVEILGRVARMPVGEVADGTPVAVDRVYVVPPAADCALRQGVFHLTPWAGREPLLPVDTFFQSLAEDRGDQAVGVVLSGAGTDGTRGLKAIRAVDGITFAQDATARYDGMPASAAAAGCADSVLPPEGIAAALLRIARGPGPAADPGQAEPDALPALLRAVQAATGVDFSAYKPGPVGRRVRRRMALWNVDRLAEYARFVGQSAAEARALSEDLLIHVTSFFRDPDLFDVLKTDVFTEFVADRPADVPVRIWVPGCSTGEEVYSLAITLLEFLGDRPAPAVKLFGTDLSEAALETARAGRYPAGITADIAPDRLGRFFVPADGGFQVAKPVRDLCLFARHDLARDAPFSNMDLVSCRNVLIYLGPDLQKRVLHVLHYALKPDGRLLLGPCETVSSGADLFTPVNTKHRIYARKAGPTRPFLHLVGPDAPGRAAPGEPRGAGPAAKGWDVLQEADRVVLAAHAPPGVVVNDQLDVVQFRGDTSPYLVFAPGVASLGLFRLARPGLQVPLRTALAEARARAAPVRMNGLRYDAPDRPRGFDLSVTPLAAPPGEGRYFLVLFRDAIPPPRAAPDPPDPPDPPHPPDQPDPEQVWQLRQDLATTRASLQSSIEELEARNQELQAAHEEAMSGNEELRSTNEELQTTTEELQAANEELETVNEELRYRNQVVTALSDDLANLLGSVQIPIVMLGSDLRVRRFTPSAARLFNLTPGDVGRPLGDVQSQLDVPDLEHLVGEVVDTIAIIERDAQDRTGNWYRLTVRPYRAQDNKIDGVVLSAVNIDALKRGELLGAAARDYAGSIVETVPRPLVILDEALRVMGANAAFYRTFRVRPDETEMRFLQDLGDRQWDRPALLARLAEVLPKSTPVEGYEVAGEFPGIGRRVFLLNARRMVRPGPEVGRHILLALEDITARKAAEEELRQSERRERERAAELATLLDAVPTPVFIAHDPAGRRITGNRAGDELLQIPRGAEASLSAPQETRPRHFWMVKDGRELAPDELPAQQAARGTRVEDFEFTLVFDDGTSREMLAYGIPLWDDDGRPRGSVIALVDITERKRAQEALQARETQLRSFVQQAPVSIALFDRDMNYLAASQRWTNDYGRGRADLVGLNLYGVHPGMPDRWKDAHRRGLRGETVTNDEDLWPQADGTAVWLCWEVRPWFDVQGQIGGIMIFAEDITKRKMAEESLRDREARLAAILNTATDAIISIDGQGIILAANPATDRMFGYAPGELVGRNVSVLMPPPFRDEHDGYLARYRETGVRRMIGIGREVLGRRKDGTTFPADVAVSEVFEDQQRFTGIVRDITRRKELEWEVLESVAEEARRIGRELHDGVGQELTGLGLMADALARQLAGQAGGPGRLAGKLVAGMQSVHEHVRALCRGMLLEELDAEGLRAALEDLAARTRDQAGVDCTFDCPELVPVPDPATARHVYRIAQEGVSNALRHGHPGHIRIELSARPRGLRLVVEDDGIPITRSAAGAWEGKGLGISTMRYRANSIGGVLHVGPADGKGVRVTCTVPGEDANGGR